MWYDVSETVNASFADAPSLALAATGIVWRHATGTEICALFSAYADPAFSCSGNPPIGTSQVLGDVSAGFRALLGPTAPGATYIFGFYDDEDANPNVGQASTNSFFAGGQFTLTAVGANVEPIDQPDPIQGNWLVMMPAAPVPALSTPGLLLLGAGMTASVVALRRRRSSNA